MDNKKQNKKSLLLLILAGIFFFVYSFLAFSSPYPPKFASPDETVNYFFTVSFAHDNRLFYKENLLSWGVELIHPRSTVSLAGKVVPLGFLGLPFWYGLADKAIGDYLILFLSPLLAVLGVVAFYFLAKEIFGEEAAFYSAVLLFFLPPYWYFASRGMYPNLPFAVFFIFSLFFLTKAKGNWRFLGSGLALGIALGFRLSEIFWLAVVFGGLFWVYRPNLSRGNTFLFLGGFFLAFFPILYLNWLLYGSPFLTGYTVGRGVASYSQDVLGQGGQFGSSLFLIGKNFLNYFFVLFWFFTLPSFLGGVWLWKNKKTKQQKIYLLLYVLAFLELVLFYGSMKIQDNVSYSEITLNNSYVRYWLVLYVFGLPLAVLWWRSWRKKVWLLGGVILYLCFSVWLVCFGGEESLRAVSQDISQYQATAQEVFSLTEKEAIVLCSYEDKVFFPQRRVVMVKPGEWDTFRFVPKWLAKASVYYYNKLISPSDVDYINKKKIKKYGVKLEKIKGGLYRVKQADSETLNQY